MSIIHYRSLGSSGSGPVSWAPVFASGAVCPDGLETQIWDPFRDVIDLDTPEKSKVKREDLELSPKPMEVEAHQLAEPVASPSPKPMEVEAHQLAEPVVSPSPKPRETEADQLAGTDVSPDWDPKCLEPLCANVGRISAREIMGQGLFCYAGMVREGEDPMVAKPVTSQAPDPAAPDSPDSPEPTPSPKPTALLYKEDFTPEKVTDVL